MSTMDTLEKIFLAGVGALAVTGEKTKDLLDELIARGALTVEQGKVLNEELKHTIQTTLSDPPAPQAPATDNAELLALLQRVEQLNEEERAHLQRKLEELQGKQGNPPPEA